MHKALEAQVKMIKAGSALRGVDLDLVIKSLTDLEDLQDLRELAIACRLVQEKFEIFFNTSVKKIASEKLKNELKGVSRK